MLVGALAAAACEARAPAVVDAAVARSSASVAAACALPDQ